MMDDHPYRLLVDSHSERVGRKQYSLFLLLIPRFQCFPLLPAQSCMVVAARKGRVGEQEGEAGQFGFLTGGAEDQRGAMCRILKQCCYGAFFAQGMDGMVADVLPIAATSDKMGLRPAKDQARKSLDDLLIGGSGETQDLPQRKVGYDRAKTGQGGPETFSPTYDGMGLIKHQQADGKPRQCSEDRHLGKTLCVGYHNPGARVGKGCEQCVSLRRSLATLDADTADTPLCEAAHLVVHQGEQGIDDDGKTFHHQCGEHEAD